MPVNPWGVTSTGSGSMGLGSTAGSLMAQPRPAQPVQQPQTFTQMQKQGIARPPAPPSGAPVRMTPQVMPPQPGYVRPSIDPRQAQAPGVTVQPTPQNTQRTDAGQAGSNPDLMRMLLQRMMNPATVTGGNGPVGGNIVPQLLDALHNPSAYNSDQAVQTFDRLNSRLSEGFDQQRQLAREEMARRGLGDSSIYGGRLGDLGIQQARAQSDLAGQIATQQAQQYAGDRAQAIAQAMGYNNAQQGFNQNAFQLNQGSAQQALQNLLGFGQQSFNNQVTTQQLNNDQSSQQLQFLLNLMGLV